jgi:hypothetical protein
MNKLKNENQKRKAFEIFHNSISIIEKGIFGNLFEELIGNYNYIIGKINSFLFLCITNDLKFIKIIKENNKILIEKEENNQSFCWVVKYNTEVLYSKIKGKKGIIIIS